MTSESMTEDDVRLEMGTIAGAIASRWLRIVAVTLVLMAITYAVLMFVPKMYESQAGILVEPRENAFTAPTGTATSSSNGITAEALVSSQIELLKSRDTLLRVIDQLKLRDEPEFNGSGSVNPLGAVFQLLGRKTAEENLDETVLANLLSRLTVARESQSQVISVAALSENPELASRIANAIAAAHVQRRAELSLQDTAEASIWLEQEIVKLRERVSAAETAVANYRVDNDLLAGANDTSLVNLQLTNVATQITNAQERRNTAQSRAALIRNLIESGQPIDGLPDVQASVVIQQLSQSKAALQGELAQREATLLSNHPTIRALRAQIQELQAQIATEGRRVVQALEVEAQIESDLVISLQDELARTKVTASDATTSTVELDELQREATAQRQLLESYLLRYRDAIARSDSSSALPDVRVISAAAPSVIPASPKVSLILTAVGFVAVALQVGGIIFGELSSGRALSRREEYEEEFRPAASDEQVTAAVSETTVVDVPPYQVVDPEPAPVSAPPPAPPAPTPFAAEAVPEIVSETPPTPEPFTEAPAAVALVPDAPVPDGMVPVKAPKRSKPKQTKAQTVAAAEAAAAPLLVPTYEPRTQKPLEISSLSADLALGRNRIVMVAGLSSHKDVVALADRLIADALHNGLSIARVDAGSGEPSTEPGITDLAAELVSFGDVVHRGTRDGLAEVPWGQQQTLDRESAKPLTLLEALTDIYETVLVLTGPVGRGSSLTAFSGAECRMVIVGDERSEPDRIEAALSEAAALGYHPVQFMTAPAHHAEVA